MTIDEEIEHDGTDEVVCPHCGYEYDDSYEFINRDNENAMIEIDCNECDQTFYMTPEFSVTYSTEKPRLRDDEYDKMIDFCMKNQEKMTEAQKHFITRMAKKTLLHPCDKSRVQCVVNHIRYSEKQNEQTNKV